MNDSRDKPGNITAEEIAQLREALRRNPVPCRPPLSYPSHPGLHWTERLP